MDALDFPFLVLKKKGFHLAAEVVAIHFRGNPFESQPISCQLQISEAIGLEAFQSAKDDVAALPGLRHRLFHVTGHPLFCFLATGEKFPEEVGLCIGVVR